MVWNAYLRQLQANPLRTKGITSGVLFAIGDVISQSLRARGTTRPSGQKVDAGRTPRPCHTDMARVAWLGAFGALLYGPTNHWWFNLQERYVTLFQNRPAAQAALRVGVHSAVYAPFSVATFVAWVALREDPSSIGSRVRDNTFQLWLAGTTFWVPVMGAIYRFVPLQQRVLVTTCLNLAWSTYLSFKSNFR